MVERDRRVNVTDAEITSYVQARIEMGDPESIAATAADNAKKCVRRLRVTDGQTPQDQKAATGTHSPRDLITKCHAS